MLCQSKTVQLKVTKAAGAWTERCCFKIPFFMHKLIHCIEVCQRRSLILMIKAKWWKTEKVLCYKTNLSSEFATITLGILMFSKLTIRTTIKNATISINGTEHNDIMTLSIITCAESHIFIGILSVEVLCSKRIHKKLVHLWAISEHSP
jgi:hypothetical protein